MSTSQSHELTKRALESNDDLGSHGLPFPPLSSRKDFTHFFYMALTWLWVVVHYILYAHLAMFTLHDMPIPMPLPCICDPCLHYTWWLILILVCSICIHIMLYTITIPSWWMTCSYTMHQISLSNAYLVLTHTCTYTSWWMMCTFTTHTISSICVSFV